MKKSFERADAKRLIRISRQMSAMLASGADVTECLQVAEMSESRKRSKSVLCRVQREVKNGASLADAFEAAGGYFPKYFCAMVRVGEASGRLGEVFSSLSAYYTAENSAKKKLTNAMAYPVILLFAAFVTSVFLLAFAVPVFSGAVLELGIEPEGMTRAVFWLSDFLISNYMYILLGTAALALLLTAVFASEKGRHFADMLLMKLPLFSRAVKYSLGARFCRSFSLLLRCGTDMSTALEFAEDVIGNRYAAKSFRMAAECVREGMPLSEAMEKSRIFPKVLIYAITAGERANALEGMLDKTAEFLDGETEDAVNTLSTVLQPVLMVILGALVGIVFYAVYSPMLSMAGGLI